MEFFVNILGFPSFGPFHISSPFQIILSMKVVLPQDREYSWIIIKLLLYYTWSRKEGKYLLASDLNNHTFCTVSILHKKGAS